MLTTADSRGRCFVLLPLPCSPSGCSPRPPARRRVRPNVPARWRSRNPRTRWATAAIAIVCQVNAERDRRGLSALRRDGDLAQAARGHATRHVAAQLLRALQSRGRHAQRPPAQGRLRRPGDGWRAGEDLGWGTGDRATPNALVDAWLDSPGHKRIMLSETYREIGVGVAGGAPNQAGTGFRARPTRWTSGRSAPADRPAGRDRQDGGMTASAPSGARYGVTSMIAPLQRVLVRRPASPATGTAPGGARPTRSCSPASTRSSRAARRPRRRRSRSPRRSTARSTRSTCTTR